MKKNKKRGRPKTIAYYATKVIYCERSIATEENRIIRLAWELLKKYYTYKWERWYD